MPTLTETDIDLTQCDDCDAIHGPDGGVFVALRRLPHVTRNDVVLCADCYADELTAATRLSERESQAYAYKTHGLSNTRIAEILGNIDRTTVASYLVRAANKYAAALQTVQLLEPATFSSRDLPVDLTPGTVIQFESGMGYTAVSDPEYRGVEFTHGIIKKILTRDTDGAPTQVAVYVFDPATDTICIDSHRGIPMTVDKSAEAIARVVVPAITPPRTEEWRQYLDNE